MSWLFYIYGTQIYTCSFLIFLSLFGLGNLWFRCDAFPVILTALWFDWIQHINGVSRSYCSFPVSTQILLCFLWVMFSVRLTYVTFHPCTQTPERRLLKSRKQCYVHIVLMTVTLIFCQESVLHGEGFILLGSGDIRCGRVHLGFLTTKFIPRSALQAEAGFSVDRKNEGSPLSQNITVKKCNPLTKLTYWTSL